MLRRSSTYNCCPSREPLWQIEILESSKQGSRNRHWTCAHRDSQTLIPAYVAANGMRISVPGGHGTLQDGPPAYKCRTAELSNEPGSPVTHTPRQRPT